MFMRLVGVASLFPPFEEHPPECPHCGVNCSTNDQPSSAVLHGFDEDPVGCGAICEWVSVKVVMYNSGRRVGAIRRNNPPEHAGD